MRLFEKNDLTGRRVRGDSDRGWVFSFGRGKCAQTGCKCEIQKKIFILHLKRCAAQKISYKMESVEVYPLRSFCVWK